MLVQQRIYALQQIKNDGISINVDLLKSYAVRINAEIKKQVLYLSILQISFLKTYWLIFEAAMPFSL